MASKLIFESEFVAGSGVELDIVVFGDCQGLPVGGEGVIGNGVMEEVVDFWSSHDEENAIGDSLLSL